MKEIIVSNQEAGQRLDKLLKKIFKEANDSFLYKMLRKKNIVLNKKKAQGKEILQSGDVISVFFSEETYQRMTGKCDNNQTGAYDRSLFQYNLAYQTLKGIQIVYENEHVMVVYKPQGVLSQKAKPDDLSLNEWLIGYCIQNDEAGNLHLNTFKPSVCNRLDRNTCGLVLCSKSLLGSQVLSSLIKERQIKKYYRCLVKGNCRLDGIYTSYLYKNQKTNQVSIYQNFDDIPDKHRSQAVFIKTGFCPVVYKDGFTELEIELFTGKTHQIRAQLSALGYPIVGDVKYGTEKNHTNGQLLCAYRIVFPDLVDKIPNLAGKEFYSPRPDFLLTNIG